MISADIDSILDRIDDDVLPFRDKETLKATVNRIRRLQKIPKSQTVVTHFLTKLIAIHKKQQDQEKQVRRFTEVCSEYLADKIAIYDQRNFSLLLKHSPKQPNIPMISGVNSEIKLQMLSSGEKQIVSLFSHILLSESQNYFVLIDEPELSLSVNWQRRILPDIIQSGRCDGLITVTHSPFIFENECDSYAHSLDEFLEA